MSYELRVSRRLARIKSADQGVTLNSRLRGPAETVPANPEAPTPQLVTHNS